MAYRKEIPSDLPVINGPSCKHLLTKGMFITGRRDGDPLGEVGDGNCWCGQTQGCQGPDGEFVGRAECQGHRSCFERPV